MNVLYTFPAYTITQPDEAREYVAGDVIAIPFTTQRHGTLFRFYTFGSVEDYAAKYNEDTAAAVERAKTNGHELFWLSQNATIISDLRQPHETHPGHLHGDVVRFKGRRFRLDRAPNDNLRLVERKG